MLRELDPASFAALLRELAAEAYNRDISRYRVLLDISEELLDGATLAARERLADRWLGQKALSAPRKPRALRSPREGRGADR